MTRTPWFSGLESPARIGVYERKLYEYNRREAFVVYALWNGAEWHLGRSTPEEAQAERMISLTRIRPWRGLLKEDADESQS